MVLNPALFRAFESQNLFSYLLFAFVGVGIGIGIGIDYLPLYRGRVEQLKTKYAVDESDTDNAPNQLQVLYSRETTEKRSPHLTCKKNNSKVLFLRKNRLLGSVLPFSLVKIVEMYS
jgi:hypothetical protein